MSNKEFAEMAEIYKGYKALVDAAGIDYDENDMERYLRALINKCVNYGFQEANTSLDAIQRRTTRLENDLTKAREVFKETSKEAEKFKSQLQSIRYQEKSYFEEQCQQISKENKPSSGVNPFHDAVDDFLNQLDEHSFPSEAKGEALSAFINSMGYLYWQNNATDKQKEKEPPTLEREEHFKEDMKMFESDIVKAVGGHCDDFEFEEIDTYHDLLKCVGFGLHEDMRPMPSPTMQLNDGYIKERRYVAHVFPNGDVLSRIDICRYNKDGELVDNTPYSAIYSETENGMVEILNHERERELGMVLHYLERCVYKGSKY